MPYDYQTGEHISRNEQIVATLGFAGLLTFGFYGDIFTPPIIQWIILVFCSSLGLIVLGAWIAFQTPSKEN